MCATLFCSLRNVSGLTPDASQKRMRSLLNVPGLACARRLTFDLGT